MTRPSSTPAIRTIRRDDGWPMCSKFTGQLGAFLDFSRRQKGRPENTCLQLKKYRTALIVRFLVWIYLHRNQKVGAFLESQADDSPGAADHAKKKLFIINKQRGDIGRIT